jgi:hypothetical protein
VRRAHPQHISLAGPAQRRFKLAHAVDAVGRHPTERHVGCDGTPDHLHRQARLGGKPKLFSVTRGGSAPLPVWVIMVLRARRLSELH